ncbi:M23 family metallopeptidase [Desulfosporosinus sp. Sb-LF]|uniref:M23 family metallopeptidase n=1 Tax=Desulfosporosinus sp. Sb-LF TaxID=2560027 RepID=UPI00107FC08F|nr:M23 family metallopeptidase [Desulfosporosinus sp. Sb-LF]TGE31252.1 M23 family metallopeptidase [Desulfosporosinus sp. Sb-LF]
MKLLVNFKRGLAQISILLFLALISWQLIHRPPSIPSDVYQYLSSLSPALVKQCTQEHRISSSISYEDLLSIRSTLSEKDAQRLIDQLNLRVPFSALNWGSIPPNTVKTVQRRCGILKQYTYYSPNKYRFPVKGITWYEDSFGADRDGGKRRHEGTDLFGKEGTPIVNISGGCVEQLGWNRLGGERVGVRGDDGNYYYYAHLQSISPFLVKGRRIEAGEIVGSMGHTGDALTTPDHLHFGIELPNGQWINPYPFLAVWQYWGEEGQSQ